MKQTGWPFQEGYVMVGFSEVHVFTDYRWNDGTVVRRWMIDPSQVDLATVIIRPFTLDPLDGVDQ